MKPFFVSEDKLRFMVKHTAETVISFEVELNELDSAIGDGDHGTNMSRGCKTLLGAIDQIEYDSLRDVLIFIGKTLISSIGGASGALYGTLFLTMGENIDENPTTETFIDAFDQGINETMILGSSHVNQKTILDVIVPVLDAIKKQPDSFLDIAQVASIASNRTIAMKAEKGRASYLGDRSIGHLDPGAHSSDIIIRSICEVLCDYE